MVRPKETDMVSSLCQKLHGVSLLLGGSWLAAPQLVAAQQATISGQVLDQSAATPLEAARVILTGPRGSRPPVAKEGSPSGMSLPAAMRCACCGWGHRRLRVRHWGRAVPHQ